MSTTLQLQLRGAASTNHRRSGGAAAEGEIEATAAAEPTTATTTTAAGALEHELEILTETETLRVPITGVILTGSEFDERCRDERRSSPEMGAGIRLVDVNPSFGTFF